MFTLASRKPKEEKTEAIPSASNVLTAGSKKSKNTMSIARFWVSIVFLWTSAPLLLAQDCFSLNTSVSQLISSSGQAVSLPAANGKLQLPCTQTIRNFSFVIQFAPGTERYFEDSTQFTGVLNHKNSTFLLQYNKAQNTFSFASDQHLGEGIYLLTLSSIMCMPSGGGCSNCFVQYSFEIEHTNDPAWSVDIESEPSPATLTCFPGSQVVLKGTPPPHSGFKAQWARLAGAQFVDIPGANQPNYAAALSGTYLYTLTGPAGCRASNLIAVRPPERPEIRVGAQQQELSSCAQPIVGVSVVDSGAPGNLIFAWTPSLGGLILSDTHTFHPIVGTPGIYTLIVRRADNGCADTAAISVVPGNIPIVSVDISSVSATDVLDCKTSSLTLRANASLSTGTSSYTYRWSTGAASREITVSQPNIYAVTVTALDNGCVGYGEKVIFRNTQSPAVTLSSSRDTVCAGEAVVLSVLTPDPATFLWSDGSTGMLLNVTPPTDGSNYYAVTVTANANGCSSVVGKNIARVPYPPLTCLPAAITLSHGQTVSLNCTTGPLAQLFWTAVASNVTGIASSGIGPVQGRRLELISLRSPGQVDFVVFARQAGCSSAPAQVVVHVVPSSAGGIYIPEVVIPNGDGQGSTWSIVLPPDAADPSAYEMAIYNRYGALVWKNTLASPFVAEHYPDGVYFYVLTTPEGAAVSGAFSILRRK